ncbi:MAG: PD-(D/E)XK nuclease family protein [Acetobacteraceae bacterium]|nr:PD-(D/E)XK nuclease family protein [Acetobacteraceae bacterium]
MDKPLAWSYSALTAFETCPRRYYLTRIAKEVVEPESEAIKWGNRVHQALEAYLLAGSEVPPGMEHYQSLAARIRAKGMEPGAELTVEQKVALNDSYQPVAFFAKDVWVRGILDVSVRKGRKLFVGDWKTGKRKPDSDQLKLFAALAMALQPDVDEVITSFIWLRDGKVDRDRFTRDHVPEIWNEFIPRVARMQHAATTNKYPPKPSGLCAKWCPVGKARCDYCGS